MILDLRLDSSFTLENFIDAVDKIILGNVTTSTDSDGNVYPTNIGGLLSNGETSKVYGSYPSPSVWSQSGTYWVTDTPSDSNGYIYSKYKKVHNAYSDQYASVEFRWSDSQSAYGDSLMDIELNTKDVDGNARSNGSIQVTSTTLGDLDINDISRLMVVITNSQFVIEDLSEPNGNSTATRLHVVDFGLGAYTDITDASTKSVMIGGNVNDSLDGTYNICNVPFINGDNGQDTFDSISVALSSLNHTNEFFFVSSDGQYNFLETPVYGESVYGIFYMYGVKKMSLTPRKSPGGVLTTEGGGFDLISNSLAHDNPFVLQGD